MGFKLERICNGDAIEQTSEYQQAVAMHSGLTFSSRVVDHERGASLYCLSVNDWEERPPGEYILFYKEQVTRIRAYTKAEWIENAGEVATFKIYSLQLPKGMEARDEIIDLMSEALKVAAQDYPGTSVVNIEFMNAGENK